MRNWYLEQSTRHVHGRRRHRRAGSSSTCPSRGTAPTATPWDVTDDLTGPVWRVARDAVAKFAAENPDFPWADYDNENPYGISGGDFYRRRRLRRPPDPRSTPAATSRPAAAPRAPTPSGRIPAASSRATDGGPGGGRGLMVPGTAGQGPAQTGIWVSPYTINPEDGDAGVFCHEFGHDLGLPDEYDYSSYHRRRQFRLLDDHGQRLLAGPPVGPRQPARRHERVGQVRSRLRHAQGRQARHDRHREAPARGDRRRRTRRASSSRCRSASTSSRSAATTAPWSGTPTWATISTTGSRRRRP